MSWFIGLLSEFDELGAVPTMSVMEGPLEPSPSATDAPEDASFRSIFSVCGLVLRRLFKIYSSTCSNYWSTG